MKQIYRTMKEEFVSLDIGSGQLRKFGLVVGGIILLVFLLFSIFSDKYVHDVFIGVGILLISFALLAPRALLWPYYFWMGIAIILGFFLGQALLGLFFYLLVTPIVLLRRFVGLFSPIIPNDRDTYWIKRETGWTKESMERLF